MKRRIPIWLLVFVPLGLLFGWVANNSSWEDTKIPMPPKGEALTNPFYAVQRFTEAVGARSTQERMLNVTPADAVIVLSGWHWNLSAGRRQALERWVESGGRLVVDRLLAGGVEFERWSGISREYGGDKDNDAEGEAKPPAPCSRFRELRHGAASSETARYWVCDFDRTSTLDTKQTPGWALVDDSGDTHAVRVAVGRGSVTVINATPFLRRGLFDGDHGWLFVAATQLRRGDDVRFLSEDNHPSLLALTWRHGAPAVMLGLVLASLVLWRGAVRFGPLMAPPDDARRSLAEQIRGTGQFAVTYGTGESLHAAVVRALEEAARRRVAAYARLAARERAVALEKLTGVARNALATALYHPSARRPHQLRDTIALIETARRHILSDQTRSSHGTD